jgi:hypothetical protein
MITTIQIVLLEEERAEKLKLKFYGPYRVIRRIGEVAYELELPEGRNIHNVFHVSFLKKVVGQQVSISEEFPPLDEEGQLELVPEEVLEKRERRLRSRSSGSAWLDGGVFQWRMPHGRESISYSTQD